MRISSGSIVQVSDKIVAHLRQVLPSVDIRILRNIGDAVACALCTQTVNTGKWIAVYPRDCRNKSKETAISRLWQSTLWDIVTLMRALIQEIIPLITNKGQTLILMMDQTKLDDDRQCLMVSLAFNMRALPVLWKVAESKGSLGFDVQEELLNEVKKMIPEGVHVLLIGDRFYGTKGLVEWSQNAGWSYRIRIKGNTQFEHEGGLIDGVYVGGMEGKRVLKATFHNSKVTTNIGYLHEKGHPEPWIVVMDDEPTRAKILDYSMRWGIECLFSDFKGRGFDLESTHIRDVKRIEKMIAIITIATFWAVSLGLSAKDDDEERWTEKKKRRSKKSLFQQGLRMLICIFTGAPWVHELWQVLKHVGC
jgi:hypothetical protein